jgi:two-component system, chemotaxis family, protein-glutamate methylesterase/glutaminase
VIKVLIVEDSTAAQVLLSDVLASDSEIQVTGVVDSGPSALQFLDKNKPDLITIDLHTPGMDGLAVTRRIMEREPTPVVIVTNKLAKDKKGSVFEYMSAGAVAAAEKPQRAGDEDFRQLCHQLIQTVKLMAEVKLVRRLPHKTGSRAGLSAGAGTDTTTLGGDRATGKEALAIKVVGIGASTGGPPVLKTILSALPGSFPVPICIVQHIAQGFLPGLAGWLKTSSQLHVKIAQDGETIEAGKVYLAPDGMEMGVSKHSRIYFTKRNLPGLTPSVSFLFDTLANNFGERAIGVLLTGMGDDGAAELYTMRRNGAVTICQNQESCVVFGMPRQAVKLGGASHILPPDKIGLIIQSIVAQRLRVN